MEAALARFEAAVAIAAGVPPSRETADESTARRYQSAVDFVNSIGRSPDHAQMCVVALSRAKEPGSRHMAMTGLQTLLGDARLGADLLRKVQLGVLGWLKDHFTKGGAAREPSHVLRKAAHMLAVLIRRTYPSPWASAWRDVAELLCPATARRMMPSLEALSRARSNPDSLAEADKVVRARAVASLVPGSPDAPRFASQAEAADRQRLACHVCFLDLVQEMDAEIASRDAFHGTLPHTIALEDREASRLTGGALRLAGGEDQGASAGERRREELNRVKDAMRIDGSLALVCAACADALALVPAVLRAAPGAFGRGDTPLAAVVRRGGSVLAQLTPWADLGVVSAPPMLRFHENVLRAGAGAGAGAGSGASGRAGAPAVSGGESGSGQAPLWLRMVCVQCLRSIVHKGMSVSSRLALVVQSGLHSLASGLVPSACDLRARRRRRRGLQRRAFEGDRRMGERIVFELVTADGADPNAFLDVSQQGEGAYGREICATAALLLQLGVDASRDASVRGSEGATAACVQLLRAVVPWSLDLFAGTAPDAAIELGPAVRLLCTELSKKRSEPRQRTAADAIFGGGGGSSQSGGRSSLGLDSLPGFSLADVVGATIDSLLVTAQFPPGWRFEELGGDSSDDEEEDGEERDEDRGAVGGGGSAGFAAYCTETVPMGADAVRQEVSKASRDIGRAFPAESLSKAAAQIQLGSACVPAAQEAIGAVVVALRAGGQVPDAPQRAVAEALVRADGSHWRGKAAEWDVMEAAMLVLYAVGEGIGRHASQKALQAATVSQLIATAPWTHPQVEVVLQFLDVCQRFAPVFGQVPGLFSPVVRALHGPYCLSSRVQAVRERAAYVLLDAVKQVSKLGHRAGQPAVTAVAQPLLATLRQRLAPSRLPNALLRAAQSGDATAQAAVAKVHKAAPSSMVPADRLPPALSVSAQGYVLELCGFLLKQPWVPARVRGGFTAEALRPMGSAVAAAQGALVSALNLAAAARLRASGASPPALPMTAQEALQCPAIDAPPWVVSLCRYTADLMRGVASLVKPFHQAGPELRPTLSGVVRGAVDVIRGLGSSAAHPLHASVARAIFGTAPAMGGSASGSSSSSSSGTDGESSARSQPRKAVRWPPHLAAACDHLRSSARLILHHATHSLGPESAHHIERALPSMLCVHPNALASTREAAIGGPGAKGVLMPNECLHLVLVMAAHSVKTNQACPANASLLLRCLPMLLASLRACGADTAARAAAARQAIVEAASQGGMTAIGQTGAVPGHGIRGAAGLTPAAARALAVARSSSASAVLAAAGAQFQDTVQSWLRLLKDTVHMKLQGCFVFSGCRGGAMLLRAATSPEGGSAAVSQVARDASMDPRAMEGSIFSGVLASLLTAMTSQQLSSLAPARGACEVVSALLDAWAPLPPTPTGGSSDVSGAGGVSGDGGGASGGAPGYLDLGATSPDRAGGAGVHPTAVSSPTRSSLMPVGLSGSQAAVFRRWYEQEVPGALMESIALPLVRGEDAESGQLIVGVAGVLVGLGRRAGLQARDEQMRKAGTGSGGRAIGIELVPVSASQLAGRLATIAIPAAGRSIESRRGGGGGGGGGVGWTAEVQEAGRRFASEVHEASVRGGAVRWDDRIGRVGEALKKLASVLKGGGAGAGAGAGAGGGGRSSASGRQAGFL